MPCTSQPAMPSLYLRIRGQHRPCTTLTIAQEAPTSQRGFVRCPADTRPIAAKRPHSIFELFRMQRRPRVVHVAIAEIAQFTTQASVETHANTAHRN